MKTRMKSCLPRTVFLHLLLLCPWLFGSCAGREPSGPSLVFLEGFSGHFGTGQIIHARKGKAVSFEDLVEELGSKDLIFIGEKHNNPDHHLVQIQLLQALMEQHPFLVLAMESFQRPHQYILDRYMEGELTEEEFLREVNWGKTWGYDYRFYRPLLLMAKQRGIRVLAINAPSDIVRKVARSGLANLKPGERDRLADEISLDDENHRAYVFEAYKDHDGHGLESFDFFYEAQCVWEDTMAETVAEYLAESHQKVVVIAGNGHIVHKFGVPNRAVRRFRVPMATVMPVSLSRQIKLDPSSADYIWLTSKCPKR